MKRILLLSSICVLTAAFAFAQYGGQPSTSSDQGTSTTTMSTKTSETPVTLQGCLSGSPGNFTFTDQSGKTFQLSGNTSGLQAHVGHTIQLNGTTTTASSSTSTSATSTGSQPSSMSGAGSNSPSTSTFQVSSFKHVSPTCETSKQ